MFSKEEKIGIATGIEKLLLDLNHPEMPSEKPNFSLRVYGKEKWSWATIQPNWSFGEEEPGTSLWNEEARILMKGERK